MENYLRNKILKYSDKFSIEFTEENINSIIEETKKGIYAFQIIYIPISVENKYKFKLFKPLDVSKLKVWKNAYNNIGNTLWSYDGGKTFKYSDYETLKFDLRIIRELKLNQIL